MKQFGFLKMRAPKRSSFDLSHENKLTFPMGKLTPTLSMDCAPGDTIKCSVEHLVKFQALKSPMMHRCDVFNHFFFVPYRLLYPLWETFITGGPHGTSHVSDFPSINFAPTTVPEVQALFTGKSKEILRATLGYSSLLNYLGYLGAVSQEMEEWLDSWDEGVTVYAGTPAPPTSFTSWFKVPQNSFKLMAYYKIFNDYYINLNTRDELPIPIDYNILNSISLVSAPQLLEPLWEKDYFTSCLPFTQRGNAVEVPLSNEQTFRIELANADRGNYTAYYKKINNADYLAYTDSNSTIQPGNFRITNSATINELRENIAIQQYLEKNAVAGPRYIEQLLMRFGVTCQDSRLQRTEYIFGTKTPIRVGETVQTSETTVDSALGSFAGKMYSSDNSRFFKYDVKEHGLLMCISFIRPRTAYYQGVDRQTLKFDKLDFITPELAHIGEQAVNRLQVMNNSYNRLQAINSGNGLALFGYQPNYEEYRSMLDEVHGDFQGNLDYWHMARQFALSDPVNYSPQFVQCTPTTRVFAGTDTKYTQALAQFFFKIYVIRCLPKFGIPGLTKL